MEDIKLDGQERTAESMQNMDNKDVQGKTLYDGESKYVGLGGWLILVAIGLFGSALLLLVTTLTSIPTLLNGDLMLLSDPGHEAYSPFWVPLILFEFIGNLSFLVFSVVMIVFYFKKKSTFPKLMIIFYTVNAVFILIDFLVAFSIPYLVESGVAGNPKELVRAIVTCAIWIPYFLNSKRVEATFVNE